MNIRYLLFFVFQAAIAGASCLPTLADNGPFDQRKLNNCLLFHPSKEIKDLAVQIVKAAVLELAQQSLISDFDSEVRRLARTQCGISEDQEQSTDFNARAMYELRLRFDMAIDEALGGRAISQKGQVTFDSGDAKKCLFQHSKPFDLFLTSASLYERLSGDRDGPGFKALSARLKKIGQVNCALTEAQVASPEFEVTIADYLYEGSFKLIRPLPSRSRLAKTTSEEE